MTGSHSHAHVRSGPGPLRKIYEKMSELESEVIDLRSQLRLVTRKLQAYEKNSSVKEAIVNKLREQQFSLTLTPIQLIQDGEENQPSSSNWPGAGTSGPATIKIRNPVTLSHQSPNPESETLEEDPLESNDDVDTVDVKFDPGNLNTRSRTRSMLVDEQSKPFVFRKRPDKVWKKYIVTVGPNGKRCATCRACGVKVSDEVPRLKIHLSSKCSANPNIIIPESQPKPQTSKGLEPIDCNTAAEANNTKRTNDPEIDSPTPERPNKKRGRVGRKSHPVWNHYDVKIDSTGKKSATCRQCENRVGVQPSRLKNHLKKHFGNEIQFSEDEDSDIEEVGIGNCDKSNTVTDSNDHGPKSQNKSKIHSSKMHAIWDEYVVSIGPNGKRAATCRFCGLKYQLAKAPRLKQHFKKCSGKEIPGSEDEDNEDEEVAHDDTTDSTDNGTKSQNTSKRHSGGRKMHAIWDEYDVSIGPTGKRSATCRFCKLKYQAAEAPRLKQHFKKCSGNEIPGREDEDIEDDEVSQDDITDSNDHGPKSRSKSKRHNCGRKRHAIWDEYDVSIGPTGKRSATCRFCTLKYQAAEAPRLKQHFKKCSGNEIPGREDEDIEDDEVSQDDITDSNDHGPKSRSKSKRHNCGRKRHAIWDEYDVSIGPTGKRIATCRLCSTKYQGAEAPRLKQHLKKCPESRILESDDEDSQDDSDSSSESETGSLSFVE